MGAVSSCQSTWVFYLFLSLVVFFSSFHYHYLQSDPDVNPSSSPPPISHQNNSFPIGVEKGGSRYNKSEKTMISGVIGVEEGLARARAAIKEASKSQSYSSSKEETFVPKGSVYVNPYAFHQSHVEMEKRFKVWVYKEGEMPLFHKGPMVDIYSVEGQFIDEMESGKNPYSATNPNETIAFFLPVSIANIIRYVYRPYTDFSRRRLQNIVEDYVHLVSNRYPFWNRTSGADHFLVACHDWAPDVSSGHPNLFKNFIRGLCNANASEGFKPNRDVSLPEIKIPYRKLGQPFPDMPVKNRSVLAFFAGGEHGSVRKILFNHWRDKDKDIQVHEYLPQTLNYTEMMGRSKYCLCPSGHEVASPRIVESISAGCVPVIISDSYILPFSDVLNWTQLAVHVPPAKIPAIKSILNGISMSEYLKKQKRVVQVRQHFEINRPSKPYDFLDMIMHSIWLRRLNV